MPLQVTFRVSAFPLDVHDTGGPEHDGGAASSRQSHVVHAPSMGAHCVFVYDEGPLSCVMPMPVVTISQYSVVEWHEVPASPHVKTTSVGVDAVCPQATRNPQATSDFMRGPPEQR